MKSFLLNRNNKPIVLWGLIPQGIFFEGKIPENYYLAVAPSSNMIVIDVDVKDNKNGFNHIPEPLLIELNNTFNYQTKSGGRHYWLVYTGDKTLLNRATKYGIDLRIGHKGNNCGGYVKYYHDKDIRECIHLINDSSSQLNKWIETLFT